MRLKLAYDAIYPYIWRGLGGVECIVARIVQCHIEVIFHYCAFGEISDQSTRALREEYSWLGESRFRWVWQDFWC